MLTKNNCIKSLFEKRATLNYKLSIAGFISGISLITDRGDVPVSFGISFQDPATPLMEGIIDLHHDIFFFITMVIIFVFYIITRTILTFREQESEVKGNPSLKYLHSVPFNVTHDTVLEIVWTIIPSLILVVISVPSFALLYSVDEVINPEFTVKIIGNQWYWVYEYPPLDIRTEGTPINWDNVRVESYMLDDASLKKGYFRLLEVDNALCLPTETHVRLLITAKDVLHSFAVPSLGLKMDACPGRLNQTGCFILREGVYYGQCSEICGINHAFMPIMVKAIDVESYVSYLKNDLGVYYNKPAVEEELPAACPLPQGFGSSDSFTGLEVSEQ